MTSWSFESFLNMVKILSIAWPTGSTAEVLAAAVYCVELASGLESQLQSDEQ